MPMLACTMRHTASKLGTWMRRRSTRPARRAASWVRMLIELAECRPTKSLSRVSAKATRPSVAMGWSARITTTNWSRR
ncbi:hypothetical protein D3C77_655280 [compost metagenome]